MTDTVKSYYELLGIEKTADPQQIKRAYFGLVRQYPPERFPEEFKELRAAYETLSNGEKRAEYDETGALPKEVMPLFKEAQQARQLGRYAQATDLYHAILQRRPELSSIQAEYAQALKDEGKNGKAMDVLEALCKQEPANPKYALELALSYDHRGWRKKALAQYWRVLAIDNADAECWSSLIHCHAKADEWEEAKKLCPQAVEAVKAKGRGTIYLYVYAFLFCAEDDNDAAEGYLKDILRLMREGRQDSPEESERAVSELLNFILNPKLLHLFPYIQQMADLLPHINGELQERLDDVKRYFEIDGLEKNGFSNLFFDLFMPLVIEDDSEDARHERMAMEFHILADRDAYRPQLLRLRKEYPRLYALQGTFFNEALRTRDPEKMMYKRSKELLKHAPQFIGSQDGDEDDDPVPQTVRRTEPKVGRNEPCPCGSGKKYKHCHGR
jgi:tetratricopeptide (TPR) repeat protein